MAIKRRSTATSTWMCIDDVSSYDSDFISPVSPAKLRTLFLTVLATVAIIFTIKSMALPAVNAGLALVIGVLHFVGASLFSWLTQKDTVKSVASAGPQVRFAELVNVSQSNQW